MTALIPLLVIAPLLGAATTLVFWRRKLLQTAISVATFAITLGVSSALLATVHLGDEVLVIQAGGWIAPFGISLVVDRLSALMVVVTSIVLFSVLLFSIGQGAADGDEETPVSIFAPTYLVLAAGVYDAFIAGDLFNLYFGFEILLVVSFGLITLGGTEPRLRAAATYVIVSLISSVLFLASIAMIYGAVGTVNMAEISTRMAQLPQETQLVMHLMLLVAFGIKAALFPLSFWLPDSYPSAPAPVTAVFAGLLTKVGVYAILRSESLLFASNDIEGLLICIAVLTMMAGILGAVSQAGIRRMLSFTLVSHIGYMIFGIALSSRAGWAATVYYIMHHILVQSALFLVTGLIERAGGSTSLTRLAGMLKKAPLAAVLFFIPMLNLSGIPPFSGFIGKLGLFTAGAADGGTLAWTGIAAGAVTSLLTLYALVRVWNLGFWRRPAEVESFDSRITSQWPSPGPAATRTAVAAPGERTNTALMNAATCTLVGVTVLMTVFAGPIYDIAAAAAEGLQQPGIYLEGAGAAGGVKP